MVMNSVSLYIYSCVLRYVLDYCVPAAIVYEHTTIAIGNKAMDVQLLINYFVHTIQIYATAELQIIVSPV